MANANGSNSGTTAEAVAKTRESRNNHKAASISITDAATAQSYIDAVMRDTATDKDQSMFNASGFTTPGILNRQSPQNLLRMSVAISSALAAQVSADGETGEQAKKALTVVGAYAKEAGRLQIEARNQATLSAAAALLGLPASATNEQVKAGLAKQAAGAR